MPTRKIPIAGPWITEEEVRCVTDAATRCWYGDANEYHDRFEKAFASYVGTKYAVFLPSGTSALHLSMAALGVGEGDEVIVPEATWIASAAPISYLGAKCVFADIDPKTWCLSVESVEAALSKKTRAVVAVDLYGNMPDYDRLQELCQRRGVAIIEDAAEAVGAYYRGRAAGSFGRTGTFSFHGSKTLTTGEGGMLVTDDAEIYERVLFLSNHGRKRGDNTFQNTEIGFKYKASSMQAALGYAQLSRIDEILARKRESFSWYQDGLAGIAGIQLNNPGPEVDAAYWLVTVVWDERYPFDKVKAARLLQEAGLDTRPFFSPLSSLAAYEDSGSKDWSKANPNAYRIGDRGINLPSALTLTEEEVEFVCATLRATLFRA